MRKCSGCLKPRNTQTNGYCRPCNEGRGLRKCRRCLEFLPVLLSFVQKTVCNTCAGRRGRPRRVDPAVVADLRAQGMAIKAIARALKVDPATVRYALRKKP